jgi:hypothetical protein
MFCWIVLLFRYRDNFTGVYMTPLILGTDTRL